MTDKIEWPIDEPIETAGGNSAIIYAVFEGSLYGRIGYRPTSWSLDGLNAAACYTLIPPKREPRTGTVWTTWNSNGELHGTTLRDPAKTTLGILKWHKHTITHPDDLTPITREDVLDALVRVGALGRKAEAASIMALLDERGITQ